MIPNNWPQWIIVPIALGLTVLTIIVGLVLEPAAQAIAPQPEPTPTHVHLMYASIESTECTLCHADRARLAEYVSDEEEIDRLVIFPSDVTSTHGRLGCITCPRGVGDTADMEAAHEGMFVDPSLHLNEECMLCHHDIPEVFPEDRLRTPHDQVSHGLAANVTCSDCHGGVGHGFDPTSGEMICSMTICLDCHEERSLEIQLEDCNACHISPHDIALSCDDCHISTERWNSTQLSVHPLELTGWHAEINCFDCHDWPDFAGLDSACGECHNRPHDFGDDNCEVCHTPDGWSN
jgi:hypothetical protein